MKATLLSLSLGDMWMLLSTIIYGVSFGIGNTMIKVRSILTGENIVQKPIEKVLDILFIISIMYLTIFVFEVI